MFRETVSRTQNDRSHTGITGQSIWYTSTKRYVTLQCIVYKPIKNQKNVYVMVVHVMVVAIWWMMMMMVMMKIMGTDQTMTAIIYLAYGVTWFCIWYHMRYQCDLHIDKNIELIVAYKTFPSWHWVVYLCKYCCLIKSENPSMEWVSIFWEFYQA